MSHCKLYIVEGLPFSGKSTTSRHIAEALRRRGHPVACWDEGSGNHPADYEFHAFLTESQLAALIPAAYAPSRSQFPAASSCRWRSWSPKCNNACFPSRSTTGCRGRWSAR